MQKLQRTAQRCFAAVTTLYQLMRTIDIGLRVARLIGWIDGL